MRHYLTVRLQGCGKNIVLDRPERDFSPLNKFCQYPFGITENYGNVKTGLKTLETDESAAWAILHDCLEWTMNFL
jgi:hypothetical protein